MGAVQSLRPGGHQRQQQPQQQQQRHRRNQQQQQQYNSTHRSWQESSPQENHGTNYNQFPNAVTINDPTEEIEEFTYVYSSCQYKTPPVSPRFMDQLPTLKLDHDASHLMRMILPSSPTTTTKMTASSSSSGSWNSTCSTSSCSCTSSSTTSTGNCSCSMPPPPKQPSSSPFSSTSPSLLLQEQGNNNNSSSSSSSSSSKDDDYECLICFAAYSRGTTVLSLPCGHSYHKECLQEWFYRQCTCPYCRYEYPTDNAAYETGRRERMSQPSRLPTSTSTATTTTKISLVDSLKERQDELRYWQHRRTVLDQLSFLSPPASAVAAVFHHHSPNGCCSSSSHRTNKAVS